MRVAGAVVIVGAVGLAGSASGLGSEAPVRETAMTAGARPMTSAPDRDPSVSRSAQRGDVGSADGATLRQAARRERALAVLGRQARDYAQELASDRWVLPMSSYRLTGTFGETSYLWSTVHTGLDFAGPTGADIHAVAAGEVTAAGWAGSYGYRTIVELEDGTEIWYCHQSSIAVNVGDTVARGQVIGDVGSIGATSPDPTCTWRCVPVAVTPSIPCWPWRSTTRRREPSAWLAGRHRVTRSPDGAGYFPA